MSDEALEEAIRVVGGGAALGRAIGISPQAIYQWERVPAERVLAVERVTSVSRHRLRPDIFGPQPLAPSDRLSEERRRGSADRRNPHGYDRRLRRTK